MTTRALRAPLIAALIVNVDKAPAAAGFVDTPECRYKFTAFSLGR